MNSSKKFTFIADKGWAHGWRDRGGMSYLVKAFMEEFTSKDNVELIIKINMCYGCNLDQSMKELNIQNKDLPSLRFITDNLEFKQLNDFYNMGDIYVITSLAEGFCLGGIQAMACGKPVIATSFGGQSDFINNDNGWLLNEGEMKEVMWDVIYEGVSWKEPSIEEIRCVLRGVYTNNEEVKTKGIKALETANEYTWSNSAKIAIRYLGEIDASN